MEIQRPKEIFFLKNVLREDIFANVVNGLDQGFWKFGRKTFAEGISEDDNVFWLHEFQYNRWQSVLFASILEKLNELAPATIDYKFRQIDVYAGGKTFGLDGEIHTDKDFQFNQHGDGFMTLLFFPNQEWNPEWGGEFQFFNEEGQVLATYYPMPNTALVFDSNIPHRGLGPNRNCRLLRKYISYKTFVQKHWNIDLQNTLVMENNDTQFIQSSSIQS